MKKLKKAWKHLSARILDLLPITLGTHRKVVDALIINRAMYITVLRSLIISIFRDLEKRDEHKIGNRRFVKNVESYAGWALRELKELEINNS